MAQYGRPTSDVAAGDWGETPLFDKIDEASPNDSDFITGTGDVYCEVALGPISAPQLGTVTLRVRHRRAPGVVEPVDLTVTLVQGTTVIATRTILALADTFATTSITLTTEERAAITDWANLRVRLARVVNDENVLVYDGEALMYDGEVLTYAP